MKGMDKGDQKEQKKKSRYIFTKLHSYWKFLLAYIFIDTTQSLEFLPKIITELVFSLPFFPDLLNGKK